VFSLVNADLMETVRFVMVVSAGLVADCGDLRSSSFVDDVDSVLALEALRVDFLIEGVDDELLEFEDPASEALAFPSFALAIAGLLAIAAPIPSASANPPTLPMNRPYRYGVVATGRILSQGVHRPQTPWRYRSHMTTVRARVAAPRTGMPLGRTEVVAAVLETAADLFAERGPAATSIRDIAARSRVNHGLIHRHFGSKDALVGAVLDHLGQHLAGLLDAKADGSAIGAAVDRQLRVIARTSLDGYAIGELQHRFPTMELMLESVRGRHSTELGARLAAAHTIALQLGWVLFGDFLRASTSLEDVDDRTFARSVGKTVALILDAEGPSAS
jgi:TetR/AcrR family transcriptional regulator, repressor for neighboring sulfatase